MTAFRPSGHCVTVFLVYVRLRTAEAPSDASRHATYSAEGAGSAGGLFRAGPLDFDDAGPWADEDDGASRSLRAHACGAQPTSFACSGIDMRLPAAGSPSPMDLYGKFTWKIENFSEISKRELRSNVFEVGSYKW